MLRPALFLAAASIAMSATSAEAQTVRLPRDKYLQACAKSAIALKRVKREKGEIRYTCFEKAAWSWYNSLQGGRIVDDGPRGFFHSRYHNWDGYCAKHLRDADGTPREYFVCEVELPRR